jgi:hypothetical protein
VERINRDEVLPLLDELVKTPFFRYFKARRRRWQALHGTRPGCTAACNHRLGGWQAQQS